MSESQAVQVSETRDVSATSHASASLMDVISRAASDPNTDVTKMQQLFELYQTIKAQESDQAYSDAMNAAQEEMRPIAADAHNPQTKSKYASYAALDKALRPIYTRHGFSVSFDTADCDKPEYVRVVAKVAHNQGHKEYPHIDMPADGKGAKGGDVMTKTHAVGAATSYGRRYLLGMVFNIAVGEDDDGNSNGGRDQDPNYWIDEHQMGDLVALMEEVGADRDKFCNFLKVDTLARLPKKRLPEAIKALEAKRKAAPKSEAVL